MKDREKTDLENRGQARIIESPTLEKPLPPGQHYTDKFPIYDIVDKVEFDLESYRFEVSGEVERPISWSWEELLDFYRENGVVVRADFHCVTKWSKRALVWEGIPTTVLVERAGVKEGVVQAMVHCIEGYTTNVPLEYLLEEDSLLALKLNGEWLPPQHGAPLRLVVPQLYAWKSAKYVCKLVFEKEFRGGFWEERGYHLIGEPWEEQRYTEPFEKIKRWWREYRKIKKGQK